MHTNSTPRPYANDEWAAYVMLEFASLFVNQPQIGKHQLAAHARAKGYGDAPHLEEIAEDIVRTSHSLSITYDIKRNRRTVNGCDVVSLTWQWGPSLANAIAGGAALGVATFGLGYFISGSASLVGFGLQRVFEDNRVFRLDFVDGTYVSGSVNDAINSITEAEALANQAETIYRAHDFSKAAELFEKAYQKLPKYHPKKAIYLKRKEESLAEKNMLIERAIVGAEVDADVTAFDFGRGGEEGKEDGAFATEAIKSRDIFQSAIGKNTAIKQSQLTATSTLFKSSSPKPDDVTRVNPEKSDAEMDRLEKKHSTDAQESPLRSDIEEGIRLYKDLTESENVQGDEFCTELSGIDEKYFKKIIDQKDKSDPLYRIAVFYRSKILFLKGDIGDAMGQLDYLLRITPQHDPMLASAHGAQGIILYSLEHYEDALYSFEKACKLGNSDAIEYIDYCNNAINSINQNETIQLSRKKY